MEEDTAQYWFELGKYHSSLENSRNAIECYKKCVEKAPKFYKAWSNMAAEFFQLKNYKNSIECCKKAIKIKDNEANPWLTLGANYFQLNDDGRSYFCFHRARVLGSNKAKKFLEKAERLKDKILDAEIIDVAAEILEREKIEPLENEVEALRERYYKPKPPKFDDKDYLAKLRGFLLEIGNELIIEKGGIISVLELYSYIKAEYPLFDIPPKEVLKALRALEKNNLIVGIKTLEGSNINIVQFVPSDLTSDLTEILNLAAQHEYLTLDEIISETGWNQFRIMTSIQLLEEKGIVKSEESYREGKKWYFPTLNLKK